MRTSHQEQPSLPPITLAHSHAAELEAISVLLDEHPTIAELATQALVPRGKSRRLGAEGMSGDQVVRATILRQIIGCSYDALAFHLQDSMTYQRFCRIGLGDNPPKKSTLARNIKRLGAEIWEAINWVILKAARERDVEKGRKVRVDCTAVDTPIHDPTDNSLLADAVRVLARLLASARQYCDFKFHNRTRRAKRRSLAVQNAKKAPERKRAYRQLLVAARETIQYVEGSLAPLRAAAEDNGMLSWKEQMVVLGLLEELTHYLPLAQQVVTQTERRVLNGEKLSPDDKIVSLFEEHTDIIVKDRRETLYGHKICLSTGPSSLILDCVVLDGNPADSTLVEEMLERHERIFGRPPRQAAFDGGFASKANVTAAKNAGVKDICFSKRRGIDISDMAKSTWVYKRLKRFRAGIEGCISFLKRCFGLDRCRWRSKRSFDSYVKVGVVACNLLILARHALA